MRRGRIILLLTVFLAVYIPMLLLFYQALHVIKKPTCPVQQLCVFTTAWGLAETIFILVALGLLLAFIISLLVLYLEELVYE